MLGERRRVIRVNKIFYVVLSGFDPCKSKLHKTEMPQTAYLLGVQEKFPTNLNLKHGKHYFSKKHSIKAHQWLHVHRFHALQLYILIHHCEPCQAELYSLALISIKTKLSYNDTKKRIISLQCEILHGWVVGTCQAMADGKTKTEP